MFRAEWTHVRALGHPAGEADAVVEVFCRTSGHALPVLVLLDDQAQVARELPLLFGVQRAQAIVHLARCCTHICVRCLCHAARVALASGLSSHRCLLCTSSQEDNDTCCTTVLAVGSFRSALEALCLSPFRLWFPSFFPPPILAQEARCFIQAPPFDLWMARKLGHARHFASGSYVMSSPEGAARATELLSVAMQG